MLLYLEYKDNIYGVYFCLKEQQISGIKCRYPCPIFCKSNVFLAMSSLIANARITVCDISLLMSAKRQTEYDEAGRHIA